MDFLDFNLTHFLDALAAQYRAKGYDVAYQPFHYGSDFLPLAGSATQRDTVLIDHDSDFIIASQQVAAFDPTSGLNIAFPNILSLITFDTSQRQLQSQAVPIVSMFGTGQRPHLYFKPLVLPAKSSFTVQLQNLGASSINVRLTFSGAKAFLQRGR